VGEKRRFWLSRPFLIIAGSILAVLVCAYGWGIQTWTSWKFRHEAKHFPVLNMTPRPLPAVGANRTAGMQLADAGFTFEVPWSDPDSEKTKQIGQIALFAFRSGRVVEFFPPGPVDGDLLAVAEHSFGDSHGNLKQLFGPESVKSNYAFHKTLLEATPAMLTPWMSQRDSMRAGFILLLKMVSSVGGGTGIFSVEANGWKGFQLDDPAKKPKKITLELYDPQDRHAEVIFYNSAKAGEASITQADINRVLLTLRPTNQLTSAVTPPGQKTAAAN
jgi:hypothetical protein